MPKKLFLVDGASGTGKTDLIEYLCKFVADATNIQKYTTREQRDNEVRLKRKMDLIHVSKDEFKSKKFDYIYIYGGNNYGFNKQDILKAIEENEDVFLIIRDMKTIAKIKKDFEYLQTILIYIYTDKNLISKRLVSEEFTQEEIDFRIERLEIAYESYLKNPFFYDDVLINSGSKNDYTRIIDGILQKYQELQCVDKNYIFILMPFAAEYNDLLYEFKIAAESVSRNIIIERASEEAGDYKILEQIFNNIEKASLLICDLSDEKQNVYFEAGYARGIGKKMILCAKEGTKIHFDNRGYKMIQYKNITDLKRQLIPEIKHHYKEEIGR